jgi:hypothetical protein
MQLAKPLGMVEARTTSGRKLEADHDAMLAIAERVGARVTSNAKLGGSMKVRRSRAALALLTLALAVAAFAPASASAYEESYGNYNICGSNCYVQSGGAHTFNTNIGSSAGNAYLACQLFNGSGVNSVSHGYGSCSVSYGGGQHVWARVYNQSGFTTVVGGYAHT